MMKLKNNIKKTLFILLSLFYNITIFAQTQYDYYDDGAVAGGADRALNGIIIIGGIVVIVIIIALLLGGAAKIYYLFNPKEDPNYKRELYIKAKTPVDLGLSVMWAPCNIGADSLTNKGKYYAWGEIIEHYRFTHGLEGDASSIGDISGNPRYDVARYKLGNGWRIPTLMEGEELIEKCRWQKVNDTNKQGYNVIGPNGNSIFLPRTGMLTSLMSTLKPHDDTNTAYYWLSTPFEEKYTSVLEYDFEDNPSIKNNNPRCYTQSFRDFGFCVRAVKDY